MGTASRLTDLWFDPLDGRQVTSGHQVSKLLVQGIHVDGDTVWIQVARSDQPSSRLLLHVRPQATIRDVLAALRESPAGDRIEVPRAA